MLEIFRRQELRDPQMAPVYSRCPCCGGELYSIEEEELHGGLCEECFRLLCDDLVGFGEEADAWDS